MFGYGVYMEFTPSGGNGGNQQIVLAAKTGFPRFSDVHGNGSADKQPVSYSIVKDSDGTPVEIGLGYLSGTSGGDQLERAVLEATWNGTTYSKLPSSRITLTDGTLYRVYCAHQVNVHALGYKPIRSFTNQYVGPANRMGMSTGTLAFATNGRLVAWPVLLLDGGPFDGFHFRISAASDVDVALYRMRADGDPGELIVGVSEVSANIAVGSNTLTFSPVTIDPGWYFFAMCSQTSPSFWNETLAFGAVDDAMNGTAPKPGMYVNYTLGSLPNPYGTPALRGYAANGASGTAVPQLRLRRA